MYLPHLTDLLVYPKRRIGMLTELEQNISSSSSDDENAREQSGQESTDVSDEESDIEPESDDSEIENPMYVLFDTKTK